VDKKSVIKHLGRPHRIITAKERLRSRTWKCSTCKAITMAASPIPVPAPYPVCGSIAFETIDASLM
jgi:hypothetical protein